MTFCMYKVLINFAKDWFTKQQNVKCEFQKNIIYKYTSWTINWSHIFWIIDFLIVLSFTSFLKNNFTNI